MYIIWIIYPANNLDESNFAYQEKQLIILPYRIHTTKLQMSVPTETLTHLFVTSGKHGKMKH